MEVFTRGMLLVTSNTRSSKLMSFVGCSLTWVKSCAIYRSDKACWVSVE